MHRVVGNCFKAIALSIIFVIIWDVGFYLWRVNALNDRVESLAVSMQEVITKNNYIPSGQKALFEEILRSIRDDMNSGDAFIQTIGWNSSVTSSYSPTGISNLIKQTDYPASYGDVMVLHLEVVVNASGWTQQGSSVTGGGNGASTFVRQLDDIVLSYVYLVPCLNYTTVTN